MRRGAFRATITDDARIRLNAGCFEACFAAQALPSWDGARRTSKGKPFVNRP